MTDTVDIKKLLGAKIVAVATSEYTEMNESPEIILVKDDCAYTLCSAGRNPVMVEKVNKDTIILESVYLNDSIKEKCDKIKSDRK